jgi:hypothetical protein
MVSFFAKKCVKNGTMSYLYDSFGTPGWGRSFIGSEAQPSPFGDGMRQLIKNEFEKSKHVDNL